MVSTADTSSNGPSPTPTPGRDLRDRALFRTAIVFGVLLLAFAATKSCARHDNKVSQDEAVAIAKEHVDFTPDDYQVRYLPQGIPPVYFWAVSLYTLKDGAPDQVEAVLVNATTGAVEEP